MGFGKKKLSLALLFGFLSLASVAVFFQNCAPTKFNAATGLSSINQAAGTASLQQGTLTVQPTGANPPLDLFFVIDNSASMLGHQINLGNAFSTFFQSQSVTDSLSNFDTRIFIFSTASTVNNGFLGQIPTKSPVNLSPFGGPTASASTLATIPGAIFGLWQTNSTDSSGASVLQVYPSSVLDSSSNGQATTRYLSIPKKGSMSSQDYQNQIKALSAAFQNRLAYLDPTAQLGYEAATDISSGLCTMARVLRHSSDFIPAGDAAAFILISDDNDRMNVRNPNNNTCLESMTQGGQVQTGTCGHSTSTYDYNTNSSVNYTSGFNFHYASGTEIDYTYPNSESCNFNYNNGYKYTSTYTLVQTQVTYQQCANVGGNGDGTCLPPITKGTATLTGNFIGSNGSCTTDMTSKVSQPAPGTTFTCTAANLPNQSGPSGVDAASTGTVCSQSLLSQLTSDSNKTGVVCLITTQSTGSIKKSGLPLGSCANFCSQNSGQYPGCTMVGSTTVKNGSSKLASFSIPGLTCDSVCPAGSSAVCGTGSIRSYLTTQLNANGCTANVVNTSGLTVTPARDSAGAQVSLTSLMKGLSVLDGSGNPICPSVATTKTLNDCLNSLVPSGQVSGFAFDNPIQQNVSVATPTLSCSTACSASGGFCDPAKDNTVDNAIARLNQGICNGVTAGGLQHLPLQFKASLGSVTSWSQPCADVVSGSCDGHGWGATDGSTVLDYVQKKLLGTTAGAPASSYSADTASVTLPTAQVSGYCGPNAVANFSGPTAGGTTTVYAAGDSNHTAADFQNYIKSQTQAVFGRASVPVAVITQLPGDNLQGTAQVGQDYINLATAMGSNVISSVTVSDYSPALKNISQYIVTSTQNSFTLPITASEIIVGVSVTHVNSSQSVALDPSQWSWIGQTLSISPSANLAVGDQVTYKHHP
jgi:hypothetical protein